jgi:hypothetical protein
MSRETWEYAQLFRSVGRWVWIRGAHQEQWEAAPIGELLNRAGSDGWELIATSEDDPQTMTYTFKRRRT